MGHRSRGSWVSSVMGQMGRESQNSTHFSSGSGRSGTEWAVTEAVTLMNFLWPPYEIGGPLYFGPVDSFFLFIYFPRLISAAADRMSTILPHMVWP